MFLCTLFNFLSLSKREKITQLLQISKYKPSSLSQLQNSLQCQVSNLFLDLNEKKKQSLKQPFL